MKQVVIARTGQRVLQSPEPSSFWPPSPPVVFHSVTATRMGALLCWSRSSVGPRPDRTPRPQGWRSRNDGARQSQARSRRAGAHLAWGTTRGAGGMDPHASLPGRIPVVGLHSRGRCARCRPASNGSGTDRSVHSWLAWHPWACRPRR